MLSQIFLLQVEVAHWFYLDHIVKESSDDEALRPCSMREFTQHVFRHVPFLSDYCDRIDEVFAEWQNYKSRVPTYGAVLLDETLDHVLLVRGIKPVRVLHIFVFFFFSYLSPSETIKIKLEQQPRF